MKFDCFELAVDSVTDVDGGEEELVTAVVKFCCVFVVVVEELRCDTKVVRVHT